MATWRSDPVRYRPRKSARRGDPTSRSWCQSSQEAGEDVEVSWLSNRDAARRSRLNDYELTSRHP